MSNLGEFVQFLEGVGPLLRDLSRYQLEPDAACAHLRVFNGSVVSTCAGSFTVEERFCTARLLSGRGVLAEYPPTWYGLLGLMLTRSSVPLTLENWTSGVLDLYALCRERRASLGDVSLKRDSYGRDVYWFDVGEASVGRSVGVSLSGEGLRVFVRGFHRLTVHLTEFSEPCASLLGLVSGDGWEGAFLRCLESVVGTVLLVREVFDRVLWDFFAYVSVA